MLSLYCLLVPWGSPLFSIARMCRFAIRLPSPRGRSGNDVADSSLFIFGSVCPGNPLYDLNRNLLEICSGTPFILIFHFASRLTRLP